MKKAAIENKYNANIGNYHREALADITARAFSLGATG